MPKNKHFSIEKYDSIKKILSDYKIESYDIDNYIQMKHLRYDRHRELNTLTDEQMIEVINEKYTKKEDTDVKHIL